jgi:hypothetical protein
MGSYSIWRLSADTTDTHTEQLIIAAGCKLPDFVTAGSKFSTYIWKQWTNETKWIPFDSITQLSKDLDVVFRLEQRADWGNEVYFYYKGECLEEKQIWKNPQFPTRPLFQKKRKQLDAEQKLAREKLEKDNILKEKQKVEAELEQLKKRQAELEEKLKVKI